ncbi:MAG: DUF1615 family protein [Desulfomonile tiedjei]|nr:DUF1615 family protein [Desulfomonile tiedjei]
MIFAVVVDFREQQGYHLTSMMRCNKKPRRFSRTVHTAFVAFLLVFPAVLSSVDILPAKDMVIASDEDQSAPKAPVSNGQQPTVRDQGQVQKKEKPGEGVEDEKTKLLKRKEEHLARLAPFLEQEQRGMLEAVQILNNEAAYEWLGAFISSRPLNCPLKTRNEWVRAIVAAVQHNNLPVCKEILGLVASIVSIESGFNVDPPALDPSRGETMPNLLDRAEKELHQKMGPVMSMPPVPQLYSSYKEKYQPRLLRCRTEGEIEAVARTMADELKRDAEGLPGFIKNIILKEVDKVANVVKTKGSMQLSFARARQVMLDRGEEFTDRELSDYMYTLNGGLDVGVAALKPMFVQYAARYGSAGTLSWLFFVGMDYHYGPFTSRNVMEQIRIRDLSGRKIALDGDFLPYDEKGRPEDKESETLQAVRSIFPSLPRDAIYEAFLLEKEPHYVYSDLHKSIASQHTERFGATPFAVIGELFTGNQTRIKHGFAWKTRIYLNKLDRYLNCIPWDE